MLLCPDTELASEVCDCEQRHLCPSCGLPIPENASFLDIACGCDEEDGEEVRFAILEEW